MRDWDYAFYGRCFNSWCRDAGMPTIDYPEGTPTLTSHTGIELG